jgi:hypothetical protein
MSAQSALRWQSVHSALQELWDGNDITATLDQIYIAEPNLLHSVLPQLNNFLLHCAAQLRPSTVPAAAALERQLLSICSSSLPFALELCWLLRAQPLPPPELTGDGTPSLSRRSTHQSAPAAAAAADPPLPVSPASPPWPAPASAAAAASPLRPLQAHAQHTPHAQQDARWPSGRRSPSQQLQQAHARASYVAALLGRIEEAVRRCDAQRGAEARPAVHDPDRDGRQALLLPAGHGPVAAPATAGSETSAEAQLLATLRFVDGLTAISEQLRQMDTSLRLGALRSQLRALNSFLPPLDEVGPGPELATLCARGCNPVHQKLQPVHQSPPPVYQRLHPRVPGGLAAKPPHRLARGAAVPADAAAGGRGLPPLDQGAVPLPCLLRGDRGGGRRACEGAAAVGARAGSRGRHRGGGAAEQAAGGTACAQRQDESPGRGSTGSGARWLERPAERRRRRRRNRWRGRRKRGRRTRRRRWRGRRARRRWRGRRPVGLGGMQRRPRPARDHSRDQPGARGGGARRGLSGNAAPAPAESRLGPGVVAPCWQQRGRY